MIGRLCEEFHCLPSEAWREWQQAPVGWLETIIEYRHYAAAKARFEAKGRKHDDDPGLDLVKEITFALVRDEIDHG